MKQSSELYEKLSRNSINMFSDETEHAAWRCKVCREIITVHSGTETAQDIKHVVSEEVCLTQFREDVAKLTT